MKTWARFLAMFLGRSCRRNALGKSTASLPGVNRTAWLQTQQRALADWQAYSDQPARRPETRQEAPTRPTPLPFPLRPWYPRGDDLAPPLPFQEELEASVETTDPDPVRSPFGAMLPLAGQLREIYRQNHRLD